MDKIPSISGKDLCSVLEKDGFKLVRQTGSYKIYQKLTEEGNITIPVPVHSNKPLKKGTLHNILKKAGISKERLKFLLTLLFG
ncbi:type II toxin-antitoxin system HicA family toxin [hot springs metagenome]|uniref:Type II toxin-antitoxin system HicA family toxin n=1 Tax=hot springs metagenome TaxID=433727 RepID=A0A5J4KX52_9ZZZZ